MRRLRLGMVGGGRGSFIGPVQRLAGRMDDRYQLVAGALSADAERAKASAADAGLDPSRAYVSFAAMAEAEAKRPDGIEVVAVVTPNDSHHAICRAFLDRGIHVVCDKPLTTTLEDALDLAAAVKRSGKVFVLTHAFTAYAMVREARDMIAGGALGKLRVIQLEYPQDWLATPLEQEGHKQALWRVDPARSGPGGCIGDIGTHACHLGAFVTGLWPTELCAELSTFVPGRRLDDNAAMLLRYPDGVRGLLWASQVATGNRNALRFRIYGDKGGLEWNQERPDELILSPQGRPTQILHRGEKYLSETAARMSRVPAGLTEGYLEAFGNIFADAYELIVAQEEGRAPHRVATMAPTVEDGIRGVKFVLAAVESSRRGGAWVDCRVALP